jgi:acetyl esterase/lipase
VSLQAELIRLGLRSLMRCVGGSGEVIERIRRQTDRFTRMTPYPPAKTQTRSAALGGVPALRIATPASRPDRHILYLHGGGYVTGSPPLYRHITWRFADSCGARVNIIDYRLAPEHPFPAALDDAAAAWHALMAEGATPQRTVVIGDSAGGGLTLALALRLRDEGGPVPAGLVSICPWTDLALTGASMHACAAADAMHFTDVAVLAESYLAGADPYTPYASPLYADPAGLPPTLIQVSDEEMLRDDAVRMAERMQAAGCAVEFEMWPRMPHVWHAFASVMPEARRAITRVGQFVRQVTGGD